MHNGMMDTCWNCQWRMGLTTYQTIDGSSCFQSQVKYFSGSYWLGWKVPSTVNRRPADRLSKVNYLSYKDSNAMHHSGAFTGTKTVPYINVLDYAEAFEMVYMGSMCSYRDTIECQRSSLTSSINHTREWFDRGSMCCYRDNMKCQRSSPKPSVTPSREWLVEHFTEAS